MHWTVKSFGNPMMVSRSRMLGRRCCPFESTTDSFLWYWYGGNRKASASQSRRSSGVSRSRPAGLRPGWLRGLDVVNVGNGSMLAFVLPGWRYSLGSMSALSSTSRKAAAPRPFQGQSRTPSPGRRSQSHQYSLGRRAKETHLLHQSSKDGSPKSSVMIARSASSMEATFSVKYLTWAQMKCFFRSSLMRRTWLNKQLR